jgi:hypothetical protein
VIAPAKPGIPYPCKLRKTGCHPKLSAGAVVGITVPSRSGEDLVTADILA